MKLLDTQTALTLDVTLTVSQSDANKVYNDLKSLLKPTAPTQELMDIFNKIRNASVQV